MSKTIELPGLTAYVEQRRLERAARYYFWLGAEAENL